VESIFRRKSGVYFARLVIPARLRPIIRKTELIATTGVHDLILAKIVGAEILAGWRRQLLEFDSLANVDVVRVSIGSPVLGSGSILRLREAAAASGIDVDSLIRYATESRLKLYVAGGATPGYVVPYDDLDHDRELGGVDVPLPRHMPESAVATVQPGLLCVHPQDIDAVAADVLGGKECRLVLFDLPGRPGSRFVPTGGVKVDRDTLSVSAAEVEALRRVLASRITPEQLSHAKSSPAVLAANKNATRLTSNAVDAFMVERAKSCDPDQARRVRAACDLFVELMGDPRLCDLDRDQIRHYRDILLPTVPANENKVRLQYRTDSIKKSIEAVAGTTWPRISAAERSKRMQWLCGLFEWLSIEKWIPDDPAAGLAGRLATRGSKKGAAHSKRDLFTRAELQTIFSARWFEVGHGQLTNAGTYREFLPLYFWLPLLGLFTGARINELSQLGLDDMRISDGGVWFIDLTEDGDDGNKKLKNDSSVRTIPIHPTLIALGLVEWRHRLEREGFTRLFPELKHDVVKGYSKAAVKWFSQYLARFGWPRNGRKVFHSFRHTLASECLNVLGLSEAVTAQISGHARSQSVLGTTYRKDVVPDELFKAVAQLDFQLPPIAKFALDEGVMAVRNAIARKKKQPSI
jgi:integrase